MAAELEAGAAWIDGEVVPIAAARVPIIDTGFSRSDLTYDVVSVWDGAFFRLDDHLARFERNWRALRLSPPFGRETIATLLGDLVARTGLRSAYVSMMVTRGLPTLGDRDPRRFSNCFYAYAIPFVWLLKPADQELGVAAVVPRATRRIGPESIDPKIKNFQWGDLTRSLFEAYDRGAQFPILRSSEADDLVTEGAGYNVFCLLDGRWQTPARGVFDGITRRTVLELCARDGIAAECCDIPIADLYRAEEIFLCTTAGGIMPVTTLDGAAVGDGRPGAGTRALRDAYWNAHTDPLYSTAVDYRTVGLESQSGRSG